jgi:dihydrolipoamide dehydrogenase
MVVGSFEKGCQVAVIGSGPGGYLAAIRLAQLKKDVVLIEEAESLGGICLNEGCIPSKALIHAADFLEETKHSSKMGITVPEASLDMPQLVSWKDKVVKRLTDGVRFLTTKNGAEILHGRARFTSDRTLEVAGEGGKQLVRFEQAVIATGSLPFPLPGFPVDGETVIGSKEALSLKEVPPKLVVIGGGYIGLELSCVYRKLGSEVDLVEFFPELLAHHDPEVREIIAKRLKDLGIRLHLGHRAVSLAKGAPSRVKIQDREGKETLLEADKVLVSVGRVPYVEGLGLAEAGVRQDPKGFIQVNKRMETSAPGIFAIGDVVGGPLLAHKAYREAKVAAEVIAGAPSAFDNVVVPAVIYTDPEIAWAGLFEVEAREQGYKVVTGTFPFRASGRALTLNAPEGFVKTVADAETKRILGVQIVGADASELISEAALAIEMGAFLDDLSQTIHPHPTMSEGLLESVEAALGEAIHVVNK